MADKKMSDHRVFYRGDYMFWHGLLIAMKENWPIRLRGRKRSIQIIDYVLEKSTYGHLRANPSPILCDAM